MTFFHFLNCVVLTLGPYAITYRHSGIRAQLGCRYPGANFSSEYASVWKCLQPGGAYFLTQLVKMLTWATFYPATEDEGTEFQVFPELAKSSVNVLDVLGLFIVIDRSWSGRGEVRFLTAGLGWAAADCLATRLIPFWTGALGIEFSWKYLQMSIESNFNLVYYIALATLVWLWNRRDLNPKYRPIVFAVFTFAAFRSFFIEFLVYRFSIVSWSLLFAQLLCTFVVSAVAVSIYATLYQAANCR